jgi:o-succinylbenzoate synthase
MTHPSFADMARVATPVGIPLATPFRGITHREVVIFDAPDGPSEWSPFLEYDDQEASTWLASAIEQGWHRDSIPNPSPPPATLVVNGIVPALDPAEVAAYVVGLGIPHTIKVKVGGPGSTRATDVARVKAVREVMGPSGQIRLDANASWTLDEAEHAIRDVEMFDIDYVEQPVASPGDLAELRRRVHRLGIQIAADESIRRDHDVDTLIDLDAVDVAVVKVQPLGGIVAATAIARRANDSGLSVVVSSALETSVGLHYGAVFHNTLVGLGMKPLDAGLATAGLLESDVVVSPLIAHGGVLEVNTPELDRDALKRLALNDERSAWWFARLERACALF